MSVCKINIFLLIHFILYLKVRIQILNYLIKRHKSLSFLIVVHTTIQIELYRLTNPALSLGIKLENAF